MDKKITIDQQLMVELLEEEIEDNTPLKPQEEKQESAKRVNPFSKRVAEKNPPLKESAILSGIEAEKTSGFMDWVQQHPLETLLGAIVIGGIGYKLYQHFTLKQEPGKEENSKSRLSSARRKRLRERRKSFMEKARDLFHIENEQGERTFDLNKTITAVSVAAIGGIAGAVVSEKSLPVTLAGAASLALTGVALNSPMVSLGALGLAAGAFVMELVRKSLKRENTALSGIGTDSAEAKLEEPSIAETTDRETTLNQQGENDPDVEQDTLRKQQETKRREDLDFDRMLRQLEEEELPELA